MRSKEGSRIPHEEDAYGDQAASGNGSASVKTKALLIDPGIMTVIWMNEPAVQGAGNTGEVSSADEVIEQLVPMADLLGISTVLHEVAVSGAPRHLQGDVIATARGSLAVVVSVYRLPDGMLLMLIEQVWHRRHEGDGSGAARQTRDRGVR